MGLFGKQLANVVEWKENLDETIFWKWHNDELKKDSRLIIRPGQDAVFLYNGRIEGVFKEEGNYEIASQIIPFLSSLKGFKFGFNSGLRAEILFVNTKEFLLKWGTRNAVMIPAQGLPGGLPIRCYGTLTMKVSDYISLIDQIAGVSDRFTVENVRDRVMNVLDSYLMKWIAAEGKDMFNLQANAREISAGIQSDLDMDMQKIGLSISSFYISSFSYPQEIQEKINEAASVGMVGNVEQYQKVKMIDAMAKGSGSGGHAMGDMAGSMMGMAMGMNMAKQMSEQFTEKQPAEKADEKKFCGNCGARLPEGSTKFCTNCGAKLS